MENNQHIVVSIVQELQQLLENTCVKVQPFFSKKSNKKKNKKQIHFGNKTRKKGQKMN